MREHADAGTKSAGTETNGFVRLRQIALVARDLSPPVDDLCAVLDLRVAYRDPGVGEFGLHNVLLPVGDTFLEVLSPRQADTSAGRHLDRRGGDGGYMVIVQVEDLEQARKRATELGVRIVWQIAFDDIATIHLHPRDVGGAILSFDAAHPPESWRWAGPEWQSTPPSRVVRRLTGVEIQARDPAELVARWSRLLDRPSAASSGGAHEIRLDQGVIRFIREHDGRGEGVSGVEFEALDRERAVEVAQARGLAIADEAITICGTRILLR